MRRRDPNPQVWVDFQQANERLGNTTILYNQYPFLVAGCGPSTNGVPLISGTVYNRTPHTVQSVATDPAFHRFRKFPPTGWVNSVQVGSAVLVERIPTRSRSHGFNDNNIRLCYWRDDCIRGLDERYSRFMRDSGYLEACENVRPTLDEVLAMIRSDTCISISNKFAIARDSNGMRWLYRNAKRIGLFIGADTLILLEGMQFYREELQLDPVITIRNVREF